MGSVSLHLKESNYADRKPSLQLILEVMDIHLRILESFPPQIRVTVTGAVPSRGWSHPQLLPYTYVQFPGRHL